MTAQVLIDLIAVILTLMVLSRIVGDNPLFRVAQYLFVGVSLGYAFVVVYHQVFKPTVLQILGGLNDPALVLAHLLPFLIGLLLLPRIIGRQQASWFANIPLGFIFAVGAAVALSGALMGTLKPQMLATVGLALNGSPAELVGSVVLAMSVILVLSYFSFTIPSRSGLMHVSGVSARIGRWILLVAFGFFLAGSLLTYLTALSDRLEFILTWLTGLVG